ERFSGQPSESDQESLMRCHRIFGLGGSSGRIIGPRALTLASLGTLAVAHVVISGAPARSPMMPIVHGGVANLERGDASRPVIGHGQKNMRALTKRHMRRNPVEVGNRRDPNPKSPGDAAQSVASVYLLRK